MNVFDRYVLARWAYAIAEPIMSDEEYNDLHTLMLKEYPDNEYVKRPWSDDPCPIELLKKYDRMDLFRNFSFTYGSESMSSLRSMEEVEQQFKSLDKPTRVSYKIDGWNNQINYYNGELISANTRGRAADAKESAVLMSIVPKRIPVKGKVKVIGEASIPNAVWPEFAINFDKSDQRASMATVIANGLSEYCSFKAFSFIAQDVDVPGDKYAILNSWGFETPKYLMVKDWRTLNQAITMLSKMKDKSDVLTDGLVVENESIQIALRVGAWQEECSYSYVTGYNENPTPYGLSMTLSIKPVTVDGKTIEVLNITNINQIVENDLKINSPVAFSIRSGANPQINITRTQLKQEEWRDNYEEYVSLVDRNKI